LKKEFLVRVWEVESKFLAISESAFLPDEIQEDWEIVLKQVKILVSSLDDD
jgi:hypothetical protein